MKRGLRQLSLRSYLMLGILLPVALFILVDSVVIYRQALGAVNTAYDRTLLASAKALGEHIEADGEADAAQLRAQQLEGDFERAKGSFRAPQLDPSLPLQLAKQEAANQQLQRLVSHLQRLGAQQRSGFVAPLAGLSERHPPTGLWLSRIRLAEGGSQMSLQGFSQDQELLPLYLQSLGVSPVFSGRAFADFELQRNEAGVLSFRLASRLKDEGQEHE